MDNPTIDHRGPEFQIIGKKILSDIRKIFQTEGLCHLRRFRHGRLGGGAGQHLVAGDKVLMYETGHFAALWKKCPNAWAWLPNLSPATGDKALMCR